jgi:hypothetical protein
MPFASLLGLADDTHDAQSLELAAGKLPVDRLINGQPQEPSLPTGGAHASVAGV